MEKRIISIATVVFITAGLFALFVVSRDSNNNTNSEIPTPTELAFEPSLIPFQKKTEKLTPTLTVNAIPDWKIFRSNKFSFALAYPNIVDIQQEGDNQVSFILLGPTQPEIEDVFYDGFTLTIKESTFNRDSFAEFVESERELQANDPLIQSVSSVSPSILGNKRGYSFTTFYYNEYTHFYLETVNNSYLKLTYNVVDPNDLDHMRTLEDIVESLSY